LRDVRLGGDLAMTMPARLFALSVALWLGGCAGSTSSAGGNTGAGDAWGGSGGSSGSACFTDQCVPALSQPVTWDMQIDPPSSAPGYALTQTAGVTLPGSGVFQVRAATPVTVTVKPADASSAVPAQANVLLTVSPAIGGRPDLVFQSTAAAGADGTSVTAALVLPDSIVQARPSGTLSLVPLPPADQSTPPYTFPVTIGAAVTQTLPADDVIMTGRLQSAVQKPPASTFVARLYQGGAQVSDAPLTQSDGSFQIRLPAAAAATPLTLELDPTTAGSSDPWVVSTPLTAGAGKNLGAFTLPAYGAVNLFDIVVSDGVAALASVAVRAQTQLADATVNGASAGTVSYARSGTTDTQGTAALSLLPGSANTPLIYAITAAPQPGNLYARTCVPMVAATIGGTAGDTAGAPILETVVVGRRPLLSGTVRSWTGPPVANVTVTATGTPDPGPGCTTSSAVTATTTTDAAGHFALPLDAGTYQLDYDPPSGSAVPRLTELGIAVAAPGPDVHDVTLPAGALLTGTVIGPDMRPVPSATVRFFAKRCSDADPASCFGPSRIPPWLQGRAVTDAGGAFRMVVPAPAAP
jgi:hypothetical protein